MAIKIDIMQVNLYKFLKFYFDIVAFWIWVRIFQNITNKNTLMLA